MAKKSRMTRSQWGMRDQDHGRYFVYDYLVEWCRTLLVNRREQVQSTLCNSTAWVLSSARLAIRPRSPNNPARWVVTSSVPRTGLLSPRTTRAQVLRKACESHWRRKYERPDPSWEPSRLHPSAKKGEGGGGHSVARVPQTHTHINVSALGGGGVGRQATSRSKREPARRVHDPR